MVRTAIMIDGGFYRKRAHHYWKDKDPKGQAKELYAYCMAHIDDKKWVVDTKKLYRIFYYDCPPLNKNVYHLLTKKNVDFGRNDTYKWTFEFFEELKKKRKVALRLGIL